ncbi:uncharacterized protein N0V89_008950 [Didymosphaeria variabile]|uniref:Tail specific protease domain-containing protein n=1 Tax=Didymosphaeria variabile TaxID=1932322 RepID=A0A9W9C926_9PLEO|nr:uncharacterized protein N0V89_008950 [Didymosphaeria variabile]KAJ4350329.1 hypothetical protein N0V89_008950 [Didymosphaeria variabile]
MLYRLLLASSIVVPWGTAFAADPCATFDIYKRRALSATQMGAVPAAIADECLNSIPVDKEEDQALIDEYKLWLDWQTNLAWHKNPPEGFADKSVDVIGDLDSIKDALSNDQYNSSYELMGDVRAAVVKAHDYHFQLRPLIRSLVDSWKRGEIVGEAFAMASVSKDGKELPKLYDYHDILRSDGADWSPSPISKINNQTAEEYAEAFAETYEYHDADARYNQLFPSQARRANSKEDQDYVPFGRNENPDGAYTTIEHENGTTRQMMNYALVGEVWTGVQSTDDLAALLNRTFVIPSTTTQQTNNKARQAVASASPSPLGYPEPLAWNDLGGGFFLSGQGYEDVAVLSATTFQCTTSDSCGIEWQDGVGRFLQQAKQAGKNKLVIDLRGNQGGLINLGYDLFQQLLPSLYPYGATTLHAHEALDLAGKAVTKALSNYTYEQAVQAGPNSALSQAWGSLFNYKVPMTIEAKPFNSWEEYFGPTLQDGSNLTTPQRRNLTNAFADLEPARGGMDITGYGSRVNKLNKTQPFEAKDIVLLTDGSCGSTCSIFSELMKTQGRVQQVAIGGRPNTGPMQGVGGTKGAQVYAITVIRSLLSLVVQADPTLNQTVVGAMLNATRPFERGASSEGVHGAQTRINLRDMYRINDTSLTPLEFVYEAADCRLFYTAEMVRNVTAVWQKTVDAHWGDANKTCVEGSVGHKSSLSGGVFDNKPSNTNTNPNQPPVPSESKTGAAGRMGTRRAVVVLVVNLVAMALLV